MLSWRQREPCKQKPQFKMIKIKHRTPTPKQAEILELRHSYRFTISSEILSTSVPFLLIRPLMTFTDLPALLIPHNKMIVKAEICSISSVTNFFIRYDRDKDLFKEVSRLCTELGSTEEINVNLDRQLRILMRKEHLFVTKDKSTGSFSRVVVLAMHNEREIAKVQYIDYGKIEFVAFGELRFICSPFLKLLTIPPLAVSSYCHERMYQLNSADCILLNLIKNAIEERLVLVEVMKAPRRPSLEGALKDSESVMIYFPSQSRGTQENWRK